MLCRSAGAKPDVVKIQVAEKMLTLPPEKRPEGCPLRDAIGKTNIRLIVSMQNGITAHKGFMPHGIAAQYFRVLFVLERRFGKFRSGIERGTHQNMLPRDSAAGLLNCMDNGLQVAVRVSRWFIHIQVSPFVNGQFFRSGTNFMRGIGVADRKS